ncbi:hypothetical protein P2318_25215 [Myxococcaceae bacterium GXIMD 01537]
MKSMRRSALLKVASLLMLFSAAPAISAEPALSAEDTQLASVEAPPEEGDACSKCGPAPCCIVLWTAWCGCPWGTKGDGEASFMNEAPAEELLACAPQGQPRTAPEQGQSL